MKRGLRPAGLGGGGLGGRGEIGRSRDWQMVEPRMEADIGTVKSWVAKTKPLSISVFACEVCMVYANALSLCFEKMNEVRK